MRSNKCNIYEQKLIASLRRFEIQYFVIVHSVMQQFMFSSTTFRHLWDSLISQYFQKSKGFFKFPNNSSSSYWDN